MNFNNLPEGSVIKVSGFAIMHSAHYDTLSKIAEAYFALGASLALQTTDVMRLRAEFEAHAINQSATQLQPEPQHKAQDARDIIGTGQGVVGEPGDPRCDIIRWKCDKPAFMSTLRLHYPLCNVSEKPNGNIVAIYSLDDSELVGEWVEKRSEGTVWPGYPNNTLRASQERATNPDKL